MVNNFKERANFIWSIADLLRGDYKQSEYGRVILPMTVLRRLDCVLEPTKEAVFEYLPKTKGLSPDASETVLKKKAKLTFFNKSKYDFQKLVADPNDIAANLRNYINGFSKNARSLGNKRNELSDEYTAELTKVYGAFKENEYCKIFKNEYFGYTRVTVERPLRLNFQASKERIERLDQQSGFVNLAKSKKKGKEGLKEVEEGEKLQKQIKDALYKLESSKVYKNREKFIEAIERTMDMDELKVKAPLTKAILDALSERDETVDICLDKDGKPESDSELRDCENVPLMDNIEDYFKREVLPHVSDAWMDRSKDKVGYEINFTKEFYKYKPLRPLEEIRKDILDLEKETEGMLGEILEL